MRPPNFTRTLMTTNEMISAMKRTTLLAAALVLLCAGSPLRAADAGDEPSQIAILQGASSPKQKDAACVRLKRIGTAQCVPALAALLADEQLSHSARYALESLPLPEAGQALTAALDKTTGLLKAGVIDSLGERREAAAVPALAKLLAETNATVDGLGVITKSGIGADDLAGVSASAAVALGKIGGATSIKALQAALPGARETKSRWAESKSIATEPQKKMADRKYAAVVDALLRCGNRLVADGDMAGAKALFQPLYEGKEQDHIHIAAYEGMIRSAGDHALALVTTGISGNDTAAQLAALQLARDIQDAGATQAFTELLAKSSSPALQIALLGVLSQRGDAAAAPAIASYAKSQDAAVRFAAITALDIVGDASAIPLLAEAASSADATEQKAARQALLDIRRGHVSEALIAGLATAKPEVQVELVRALSGRAEKSTVPKLLELAKTGAQAPRAAALGALAALADGSHVASLVQLLRDAQTTAARAEIQDMLGAVCQRAQAKPGFDAGPIVQGLASGDAEARAALLPVCSGLRDERVRAALRAAVADANAAVKTAAIRAVCETRDPELLPDLLAIARATTEPNLRTLALRGYVRLATAEEAAKLSNAQRTDLLKQVLAIAQRAEEKRLVLAGLANVPDAGALEIVLPLLDDAEAQGEAAQAATQIASALRGTNASLVRAALKKVLAVTTDAGRRQAAEAILNQMDAAGDFITAWQVAGPYFQDGQSYAALFDIAFAPEKPEARDVKWRALPAGTDPKQPGLLDLLKFLGGEQRVAYVRTRVHSDQAQDARLELGSDDGVKVWLNGQVVHANNTARPVTVGSDKVRVTLKEGWNTLLLKITQNNQGWEFCARFAKPDGARLAGLRFDAAFGE